MSNRTRQSIRRRRVHGQVWIVLAAQGGEGWQVTVFLDSGEPLASATSAERDRAIGSVAKMARQVGQPAQILAGPGLTACFETMRILFAAEVVALGPEHDEMVAAFTEEVATLHADGSEEDTAALAGLLEVASSALVALEGGRDDLFSADLAGIGDHPRHVLIWSGSMPAVVVCAPGDVAAIRAALAGGMAPTVNTIGLAFVAPGVVGRAMPASLRAAGWAHDAVPWVRVTDRRGDVGGPTPEQLRALTSVLEVLLASGLASASRGLLGKREVRLTSEARVYWNLASDDDGRTVWH